MNTCKRLLPTMLCAALVSAPLVAQSQNTNEQEADSSKRVIGQLLGAGVGALLGSQVGGGKGKLAAVAAGALAGAWLGGKATDHLTTRDREGIAQTTNTALETGETQTWTNPDTGVQTRVAVKETAPAAPASWSAPQREALREAGTSPPVDYINAPFVATTASNVRSGPGTGHRVLYTLRDGEEVTVIGKVKSEDWYMIGRDGTGSGYVYAPLLRATAGRAQDGNALRASMGSADRGVAARPRDCALINQEIVLPDGTRQDRDIRACRRPDGSWEAVS